MESEKIAKLPLWATVKDSYKFAFNNWKEYLKISQWWLLISLPISFVYNLMIWPSLQPSLCIETIRENIKNGIPNSHNATYLNLPNYLLMLLLGASIAVAWHRLVLRNEKITTNRYLRLDNVVWGYFAFAFLLQLIPLVPNLFPMNMSDNAIIILIKLLLVIISTFFILPAIMRLTIILPAKALGITEITVKDVLLRTKGNFWRIFIGSALCILPTALLSIFMQQNCRNDMVGVIGYTIPMFLSMLIAAPIMLTFLSLSYHHFFEKNKG